MRWSTGAPHQSNNGWPNGSEKKQIMRIILHTPEYSWNPNWLTRATMWRKKDPGCLEKKILAALSKIVPLEVVTLPAQPLLWLTENKAKCHPEAIAR